jgi:hypothetical protein
MFKRILIAASLIATPAVGQQPAPAADGNFVMHVAVNPDRSARVSFGILRVDASGAAVVAQRRELAAQCQWNQVADLPVQPSDVAPVSVPPSARTPAQFGVYAATLYSATASAKGGEPTAEEHGCVRALITAMAANAVQRHEQATRPPAQQ